MEPKKNPYIKPEESAAQIHSEAPCYTLLPCPFCGHDVISIIDKRNAIIFDDEEPFAMHVYVQCDRCGSRSDGAYCQSAKFIGFMDLYEHAVKHWNTRSWKGMKRGLKDHEVQQMVNEVRDATKPMVPHQCLREVIGKTVTRFLGKNNLRIDAV